MDVNTIEIPTEDAERFVEAAQKAAGLTFDPDWELPERFSWALGYAESKLPEAAEDYRQAVQGSSPKLADPDFVDELADEDES